MPREQSPAPSLASTGGGAQQPHTPKQESGDLHYNEDTQMVSVTRADLITIAECAIEHVESELGLGCPVSLHQGLLEVATTANYLSVDYWRHDGPVGKGEDVLTECGCLVGTLEYELHGSYEPLDDFAYRVGMTFGNAVREYVGCEGVLDGHIYLLEVTE